MESAKRGHKGLEIGINRLRLDLALLFASSSIRIFFSFGMFIFRSIGICTWDKFDFQSHFYLLSTWVSRET